MRLNRMQSGRSERGRFANPTWWQRALHYLEPERYDEVTPSKILLAPPRTPMLRYRRGTARRTDITSQEETMSRTHRRHFASATLAFALGAAMLTGVAHAQSYPSKTIEWISHSSAGS